MRILTVISGIILAAAGAFTFAFYTNAFTGLAFILGLVMLISGLCSLGAYGLSTKVSRLPDTVLVEGLVTTLFGFAVLNNEISDAMVGLFFGTWLTLAGATRISQSFAVSRYRPKDWAKVMPLAIVATVQGLLMLMPTLTSGINSMFFVGSAFIVNGFSLLIYAMYMRRHDLTDREIEAQERAEARKIAKEKERAERNKNRSLTHQQKEMSQRKERLLQKAQADAERSERMEAVQAKKAKKPNLDATMQFTAAETAQILAAATAEAEAEIPAPELPIDPIKVEEPAKAEPVKEEAPAEVIEEAAEPAAPELPAEPEIEEPELPEIDLDEDLEIDPEMELIMELAKGPVWNKPTEIPSLRAKKLEAEAQEAAAKQPEIAPIKLAAVNISEIEEGIEKVEFEPVVLPEPELAATGGESEKRTEIIEELEAEVKNNSAFTPFKALDLDDLFGDDYVPLREKDPKEATRFTQSLNLNWTQVDSKKK